MREIISENKETCNWRTKLKTVSAFYVMFYFTDIPSRPGLTLFFLIFLKGYKVEKDPREGKLWGGLGRVDMHSFIGTGAYFFVIAACTEDQWRQPASGHWSTLDSWSFHL